MPAVSRRLSRLLGAFVLAGAAVSLSGWLLGIDRLRDWAGLRIAMKPNTAVGLMAIGASLILLSLAHRWRRSPARPLAGLLGAFAASVGALTVFEHLTGRDLGIDTILFDELPGARATVAPGRMGPPASTSLLLMGTGLLIAAATRVTDPADRRFGPRSLVPVFAVVTMSISLLAICGYIFGVASLYDVPGLTGIAPHTAILVLSAGLGVMLAVPDREPARTVVQRSPEGVIMRRALPLIVVLPLLLGWLRTKGEQLGLYETNMGRSLLILSLIACLCALLWFAVSGIRKSEKALHQTDLRLAVELAKMQRLHAVSTRLTAADRPDETMLELLDTAIVLSDADMGAIQLVEDGVTRIAASRGFKRADLVNCLPPVAPAASRERGRLVVDDVAARPDYIEARHIDALLSAGVRAFQSTPIVSSRGEVTGALWTHHRKRTLPSEHELRLLDLLGRLVTQWIERSRAETERQQAEALKAKLAAIVESSDDGVVSKDLNGVITSWNRGAARLFGYTAEEAVGRSVTMLMPPERVDEERVILERIRRGEPVEHYETVRRRKDGALLDISLTISPIRDASGKVIGASKIARNITARKRAEEALRESEERFRSLVSVITDVPWTSDSAGGFTTLQPHWSRYTGQTWEQMRGRGWIDALHPDDRETIQTAWNHASRSGGVYEARGRLWHAGSQQYRSVIARATPLRNQGGQVREWVGTYTDVEEQVRAKAELEVLLEERTSELRESLNRLHGAQRLLALGNLAAGLGHDIANMVLPIRARLEPVAQACLTEEARRDIEAITQSLTHLSSLSAGLRLMALDPARNLASTEATDLEVWWSEAQGVMRAALPRSTTLEAAISPGLGVLMPRHQLTQAVFNLVRNAGEAVASRGDGWVRVSADPAPAAGSTGQVAIVVSDNGHGLSEEALQRCFEPYFSTKGRSIATGMGLAMVRGLVESAGGTISVKSEPGAGAAFTIVLPSGEVKRRDDRWLPRVMTRTAAISVPDARTAALAAMMLEGLDVAVTRHDPAAAPGAPDADLWVAHEPSARDVESFISRDACRRAVVLGGPSWAGCGAADARVSVVPKAAPPSILRDALSAAVGTLSSLNAKSEANRS